MSYEPQFNWTFTCAETGRKYRAPWKLSVAEALAIDPSAQASGLPLYVDTRRRSAESREALAGAVKAAVQASLLIQLIEHREEKDEYASEAQRLEDYHHVGALFERARALLVQSRAVDV